MRTRGWLWGALAVAALTAAGMAARGGLGDILDKVRDRLDPLILTYDEIATPGAEVPIKASLRSDLRLAGLEERRLQFLRGEEKVAEIRTDEDGNATFLWRAPEETGDYECTVRVHPDDMPETPVAPATLLVAVRPADTPIAIIDLDKTVVASSFLRVLVGGAKPMDGSALVVKRLARTHTIVYLTHRPDFLGTDSKQWLTDHGFPRAPVLTSTLGGLLAGSGSYKLERLADLKKTFPRVQLGIGDKFSDARAYVENGLMSILILHVDWSERDPEEYEDVRKELAALPDEVHVVTNWSQVADIVFRDKAYPKRDFVRRLRDTLRSLRTERYDD